MCPQASRWMGTDDFFVTQNEAMRRILSNRVRWIVTVSCIAAISGRDASNFVVILTDDLDWTLGGSDASTLSNTRRLIGDQGVTVSDWFAHTPVCCPSRAELLTGKMFHNLRIRKSAGADAANLPPNCMLVNVTDNPSSEFYAQDYFAQHFRELGYTVGVFGKHLNSKNPSTFLPPGVDYWFANGGGDYLNPSFTWASSTGQPSPTEVTFNNCTDAPCYSTAVIGNASLAWIDRHLTHGSTAAEGANHTPFWSLISLKAPHIQDGNGFPMATPAPWYTDAAVLPNETEAPRTPNYNLSCPDHHWLVRTQPPLTLQQGEKVDELYQSRLRTLLSVDDIVVALVDLLRSHNVLDNTYIVFTSDHGYRLGQLRMPQGKWHAYENDIRVPLLVRGPGIGRAARGHAAKPHTTVIGTHVDLMPTLLGFAQQNGSQDIVPETMDGMNLASHFLERRNRSATADEKNTTRSSFVQQQHTPTNLLIEYTSLNSVERYEHMEDCANKSFIALRVLPSSLPHTTGSPKQAMLSSNFKYIEYRDARVDWDCDNPPLERELFDLDADPYELRNLAAYNRTDPTVLDALGQKLFRLYGCRGETCRNERTEPIALPQQSTNLVTTSMG